MWKQRSSEGRSFIPLVRQSSHSRGHTWFGLLVFTPGLVFLFSTHGFIKITSSQFRYNARVNCLDRTTVERRDWNDCLPGRGSGEKPGKYDLVIGSDLLYDVSLFLWHLQVLPQPGLPLLMVPHDQMQEGSISPLFAAITSHLSPKGKLILMAPSDPSLSR